jgi:hypothetical protein
VPRRASNLTAETDAASRTLYRCRFQFLCEHPDGLFRFCPQGIKRAIERHNESKALLRIILPFEGHNRPFLRTSRFSPSIIRVVIRAPFVAPAPHSYLISRFTRQRWGRSAGHLFLSSSGSLPIFAAIRRASRRRHTMHPVHNVHKPSCSRINL